MAALGKHRQKLPCLSARSVNVMSVMLLSIVFFSLLIHRGLFKTDKVVGTAQLKLEALENHCDVREIIDVSVDNLQTQMHTHTHQIFVTACMCFIGDGWT